MTHVMMGIWGSVIWLHQAHIGLTGERGSPFQRSSILFLIVYDHLGVVELSDPISPTNSNMFRSMNLANKPHGHYHINLSASSLFFLRMVSHSNFQFQFLGRQNGKKNTTFPSSQCRYCRVTQNNASSAWQSSGISVLCNGNMNLM